VKLGVRAQEIRLRYTYRRMVLKGKVDLPAGAARRLVGPDCAYHLYSRMRGK
jgi:hypothetical protein